MSHTPSPFGEPVSLGGDAAIRWFAPTTALDSGAQTFDAATRWFEPMPAANGGSRRDGMRWKEVRWVGFPDVGFPDAPQPVEEPQLAVPLAKDAAANVRPAETPEEPALHAGEIRAAPAPRQPRPLRRAPHRTLASRTAPLARRLRSIVSARTVRAAGIAFAFAAVAVSAYYGGERLAGLAGAAPTPRTVPSLTQSALPHPPPVAPVPALGHAVAVPANPTSRRAAQYLELAKIGEPAAQYDLGVLYARGDGVGQDLASAASWFRKAAQGGVLAAAFNLGVMYERGLGVGPNMDEAVAWYRRAAARNYPPAQYNLAIAYAEGRGAPQDPTAAARWYRDAAMQGLAAAMVNIALLYEHGEGVSRSLPDAYAWYRAAARRGNTAAAQRARELFDQSNVADKGHALVQASAIAEALHEPSGEAPAASAASDGFDPRSAMEAGGWLGAASPVAARQPAN